MTDFQVLIERYNKNLTQLEAQIAELKRRLDFLAEASLWLEEEGLTADVNKGHECSPCCELSA